ncbi:MAG: ATPase [Ruminococcaceae bacterium]|nr:ATPase [Oscillospiraceae bacterium]
MNMDDLIEQLDEVLDGGMKLPGKRVIVDIEKVRAIVDDMRMTMPTEIKQAKGIVADRADILNNAKREADGIIRAAEERQKAMVAEEEITKLAQAKAGEILAAAQKKGRDMRKAAQDFVDDLMTRADEQLTANLNEVKKTRAALRQQIPAANNPNQN